MNCFLYPVRPVQAYFAEETARGENELRRLYDEREDCQAALTTIVRAERRDYLNWLTAQRALAPLISLSVAERLHNYNTLRR